MGDVMDEPDMVTLAENAGVLTGAGASYKMLGEKYAGKTELEMKLMYDPAFKAEIWEILMPLLLAA
jgi:hypothetical protein